MVAYFADVKEAWGERKKGKKERELASKSTLEKHSKNQPCFLLFSREMKAP